MKKELGQIDELSRQLMHRDAVLDKVIRTDPEVEVEYTDTLGRARVVEMNVSILYEIKADRLLDNLGGVKTVNNSFVQKCLDTLDVWRAENMAPVNIFVTGTATGVPYPKVNWQP